MSISIGTSSTASVWETHAAWLRLREECTQLAADAAREAGDRRLREDKAAVLESRDVIARITPPGFVDVLI